MPPSSTLISVCLPVRNGAERITAVVDSILAQDHSDLELVITDNASTDDTESVCRDLASADDRIRYFRQPENIGLLNNFVFAGRQARGTYFRWVGDDDWLAPNCLSSCLKVFEADDRLVLVTMGVLYDLENGASETTPYHGTALTSDDPIERLAEMLRLLNSGYQLIDPLYGLMRREAIIPIPRRNMLREDEVFASKMALAGPWGHTREVLARRGWRGESRRVLARRLGVPGWTAHAATTLQGVELMRWVNSLDDLEPDQRRRARALVYRWYAGRQRNDWGRRSRKLVRLAQLR
ncbi:MAG: glycosyltransferase family 2 protein [Hamadaea sp.]|uniref:glycosyltransferase family 2 protein n=1 Tax=Hamadaea sp. TaxID=2024425 RepID=UPI0017A866F1|nr:glycosyltransferase family 2 protein [Hamadaea sp.]NUR70151.1 glycosyltransferase family 2 protein [Hamadaea sp.]NUT23535.1 glycosyltransferase family 2 protein [Hamadaea sp.]